MPRKTDGILFELQPRPTKGDDGKPLLYAQPVIAHRHDLDALDDFCAKYRHTSKGEMKRLFDSKPKLYWIAIGKDDFLMQMNTELRQYLDQKGYKYEYYENDGGHIWRNWRIYLTMFAQKIFK